VSVLHVAGALDDDISVRLEQAHQLLAGRHRQAIKNAPLALGEDALDQRLIVVDPGAPAHRRDPGEVGQPFDGVLQRRLGGAGGGDQLAIKLAPFVFTAAVFDRSRALLGQAPAIAPLQCRRSRQARRLPQEARHDAHGIPQQRTVARLMHQRRGDRAVDPYRGAAFQLSCWALANSARLTASQVSGRMAQIVWCSTDFFGDQASGNRAKARNEAESSR